MFKVFDAAVPPPRPPSGVRGVLGYIGRPGFTPHVWTLGEWDRFAGLPQFPAWVPDLRAAPAAEAAGAVAAAKALGWAPDQKYPRVIVFDLETAGGPATRDWYATAAATVTAEGFTSVAYGSLSSVLTVAAADVWLASWTGIPGVAPGQTIHATQYEADISFAGTTVDFSTCDQWMLDRAGVGPRHTARQAI